MESAFNSIQYAIKHDPGNVKYYRVAGYICIQLSKECKETQYAKMALENFISAKEMSNDAEKDIKNLQNAKKHLYNLTQENRLQQKLELIDYLNKIKVDSHEVQKYFIKCGSEAVPEIPKPFNCAISLVG
jgi:hypothetical protein